MGKADHGSNPWRILKTSAIYRNNWITVEHNDVLDPQGKEGVYGIVRYAHPTVATLALSHDGRMCLVGQYRLPHAAYAWELPGGSAEGSEDVQDAAKREFQEETELDAGDWLALPILHPSTGVSDEVVCPFLAWNLSHVDRNPEPTEVIRVDWLPFLDAVQLVESGEIRDATTVAAVLWVEFMSQRGKLPEAVTFAIRYNS